MSETLSQNSRPAICSQAPIGIDCCCCKRCNVGGCDLKILDCGCCMHVRCCVVSEIQALHACPVCNAPSTGIKLLPLSFYDIDQALAEAAQANLSNKRGKKRQNATITRLNPNLKGTASETGSHQTSRGVSEPSDMRIGRWTGEETAYCDKLIDHFSNGVLPIPNDLKLHDFLANLLKSKPSRLTKKMKSARLSTQQYSRKKGGLLTVDEARELSQLETAFFASMKCNMERSEIRFHMQRVWRELFISFCSDIGQALNLSDWKQSIEEMERRNSLANSRTHLARAASLWSGSPSQDPPRVAEACCSAAGGLPLVTSVDSNRGIITEASSVSDSIGNSFTAKRQRLDTPAKDMAAAFSSASYTDMVIQHIQKHGFPFEHVDVWVPSNIENPMNISSARQDDNIRLHFAGCSTADAKVPPDGSQAIPLDSQEKFDMISFGVYSQKFILSVGEGLPGRIFNTGIPSWQQGIKSAPESLFERVGGAQQWGIETVVGLPIASPGMGRLVVLLYSLHDRPQDASMVNRLVDDLTSLLPTPRWTLTVEVGEAAHLQVNKAVSSGNDPRMADLLKLIDENIPSDQYSPLVPCLPAITLLRLLILKPSRSNDEAESLDVALNTFEAYKLEGRSAVDIVGLTSRAFMTMARQQSSGTVLDSNSCNSTSCCPGQTKLCCSRACNGPSNDTAAAQGLEDNEVRPDLVTLLLNANSPQIPNTALQFQSDFSVGHMMTHQSELPLSPSCRNSGEVNTLVRNDLISRSPSDGLVQDDNGTLDASLLHDFLASDASHSQLDGELHDGLPGFY